MKYRIYPVFLGSNTMTTAAAYFQDNTAREPIPFHYGMFVLEDENGEKILVESGRPSSEEIQKNGYPFTVVNDDPPYPECLKVYGVEPEKVKCIILTHLHYDHAWNLEKFPNAQIYVQEKEIKRAIMPMDYEKFAYGFQEGTFQHSWINSAVRMIPVEGEEEIREGLRVIPTPGHTVGSQSVLVDTKEGTYALVGDFAYFPENLSERLPMTLSSDKDSWYKSYDKLMKLVKKDNVKLLLLHCNDVLKRRVYG